MEYGVSLIKYVRGMVTGHIPQRGAAFRERGAALRALINDQKAWVTGSKRNDEWDLPRLMPLLGMESSKIR